MRKRREESKVQGVMKNYPWFLDDWCSAHWSASILARAVGDVSTPSLCGLLQDFRSLATSSPFIIIPPSILPSPPLLSFSFLSSPSLSPTTNDSIDRLLSSQSHPQLIPRTQQKRDVVRFSSRRSPRCPAPLREAHESRTDAAVCLVCRVGSPLHSPSIKKTLLTPPRSHLTLLATTLLYTISIAKFSGNTTGASVCYRLAFLSAAATYGIVVYKAYRARFRSGNMPTGQQGVVKILGDENVQYLCESRESERKACEVGSC